MTYHSVECNEHKQLIIPEGTIGKIIKAEYGSSVLSFFGNTTWKDVTPLVSTHVVKRGLKIWATNGSLGGDPCPYQVKKLKIVYEIYKPNTDNQEPSWNKLNNKNIYFKEKNRQLSISGEKIASLIAGTVGAYTGNVPLILNSIRNITLDLCMNKKKSDETIASVHKYQDNENKDIFLLYKLEKNQTVRKHSFYSDYEITLQGKISVLSPENKKAYRICQNLMNKNANALIEIIEKNPIFK